MESHRRALRGVAEELSKSISHGDTIGLGSGSTVAALLEELAPLLVAIAPRATAIAIQMAVAAANEMAAASG